MGAATAGTLKQPKGRTAAFETAPKMPVPGMSKEQRNRQRYAAYKFQEQQAAEAEARRQALQKMLQKDEREVHSLAHRLSMKTPKELAKFYGGNKYGMKEEARKNFQIFSAIRAELAAVLQRDLLELTDKRGKFSHLTDAKEGYGAENIRMIRNIKNLEMELLADIGEIVDYWQYVIEHGKLPGGGIFKRAIRAFIPGKGRRLARLNNVPVNRMMAKIDNEEILLISKMAKSIRHAPRVPLKY